MYSESSANTMHVAFYINSGMGIDIFLLDSKAKYCQWIFGHVGQVL